MTAPAPSSPRPSADPAGEPSGRAVAAVGQAATAKPGELPGKPRELGGPPGPEPTRFGDWERAGRCIDF